MREGACTANVKSKGFHSMLTPVFTGPPGAGRAGAPPASAALDAPINFEFLREKMLRALKRQRDCKG